MLYQINTDEFWLAGTEDSGFVVGSGDVEMTIALPENVARLIAKAPAMLDVLRRVADFWAGGDVPEELDREIRALLED